MALSIVEQNPALIPLPKTPDIRETQHMMGDGDGNRNHYVRSRRRTEGDGDNEWVASGVSSLKVTDVNEPVYYTYNRYAKLVRM